MIKAEINELHKIAQMGKECCEHLLEYANNDRLTATIKDQLNAYENQMHKLEKVYFGPDDISGAKSRFYSLMMRKSLSKKHSIYDLIKALFKGNIMGIESLADFISCPFNSDDSKEYARDMLKVITGNLESVMKEYYLDIPVPKKTKKEAQKTDGQ